MFKRSVFCLGLAVAGLVPSSAFAQSQDPSVRFVPPLYGVTEIVLAPAEVTSTAPEQCTVSPQDVRDAIRLAFQTQALRIVDENAPVLPGPDGEKTVRLKLLPSVSSIYDGTASCTSWLSLKSTASHTMRLPPLYFRQPLTVLFWEQGGLVLSVRGGHNLAVRNNFTQLARLFVEKWNRDQISDKKDPVSIAK
jgi:hypothetical protein